MRHLIILVISLLIITATASGNKSSDKKSSGHSFNVFCSPDLEGLVSLWTSEYCKQHPAKISVVRLTEDLKKDFISSGELGFISGQYSGLCSGTTWNMIIGRDVTVFVISQGNPLSEEISAIGISLNKLTEISGTTGGRNWDQLLKGRNKPLNIYRIDDQSGNSGFARSPVISSIVQGSIEVGSADELVASLKKDKYSIGICKMSDVMDLAANGTEGISLLPVDRNENGSIDYIEKIYDNPGSLSRGVWMGKYPASLFNNIYSVSSSRPAKAEEKDFLLWCMTAGQFYLNRFGFSELLQGERDSRIESLTSGNRTPVTSDAGSNTSILILIVLGFMSVVTFISLVLKNSRRNRRADAGKGIMRTGIFDEKSLEIMPGLYYDKSHTWAYMEKDGMVRIGLDDFIQHVTGHLTRVEMKQPGETVIKGKPLFSVAREGKHLKICSPVSGKIKEHNEELKTDLSAINSSPYNNGWVYLIEPSRWLSEINFLMFGEKYREWIREELPRLKEFLSNILKNKSEESALVLQDGGSIREWVLEEAGPEIWEDFQTQFLDTTR